MSACMYNPKGANWDDRYHPVRRKSDDCHRPDAGRSGPFSDHDCLSLDHVDPVFVAVTKPEADGPILCPEHKHIDVVARITSIQRHISVQRNPFAAFRIKALLRDQISKSVSPATFVKWEEHCVSGKSGCLTELQGYITWIADTDGNLSPIARPPELFSNEVNFKDWLRALSLQVQNAGLLEITVGCQTGGGSRDRSGKECCLLQIQNGIPFVWLWNTAKGAGYWGDAQALVVCENTAGSGLVGFAVHADQGAGTPASGPHSLPVELGARWRCEGRAPLFSGVCHG